MRLLYQLWNQSEKSVEVDEESIAPASLGTSQYLSDDVKERFQEFVGLGLAPCVVCPCRKGFIDADPLGAEAQAKARMERREHQVAARTTALNQPKEGSAQRLPLYSGPAESFEIITGRLYLVEAERWRPEFVKGMTVLLDFTDVDLPPKLRKGLLHAKWHAEDNVDEKVLAGAVRLGASAMTGIEQRVMIAASREAGTVVAACILREAMGINAKTALAIIRGACPWARLEKDFIATIEAYRVS